MGTARHVYAPRWPHAMVGRWRSGTVRTLAPKAHTSERNDDRPVAAAAGLLDSFSGKKAATPLRAHPPAPSNADVREYVNLIDALADSLADDVHGNLVYEDPDDVRKRAKILSSSYFDPVNEKLLAEAKTLEKRAEGRSDKQVTKEENFGADFRDFQKRWEKDSDPDRDWRVDVRWNAVARDDLELQELYHRYEALGYTPSRKIPPPEQAEKSIWPYVLAGMAAAVGLVVVVKVVL